MVSKKGAYTESGKHYKQGHASVDSDRLGICIQEFKDKEKWLSATYERVSAYIYYRDMFPEGSFEQYKQAEHRPNGMLSIINDKSQRGRSYPRMVFDDLEEILLNLDKNTVVISPVGYSGKRKRAKLAYQIFGMIIDLDDVGVKELAHLVYQMENGILPMATYLKNSGTGIHIVYLFEEPIPAHEKYYAPLNQLKAELSDLVWSSYTSREQDKQFQGIFQSFRVVGSPTKLGDDYRVSAYKIGGKTTLEELNRYVSSDSNCNIEENNRISLADAKILYPDWYQRRIVEGQKVGDYKLDESQRQRRKAWYHAWIERIKSGARDGNRHYCICVLFNYAMKAEIPIEEAYQDALDLLPYLNSLTQKPDNAFTEADISAARTYYDKVYIKMSLKGIQKLTGIHIEPTKRNGRTRKEHLEAQTERREKKLKEMRENREIKGRPDKKTVVLDWKKTHPHGTKADCIRDTGLTKPTVYKWWAMAG